MLIVVSLCIRNLSLKYPRHKEKFSDGLFHGNGKKRTREACCFHGQLHFLGVGRDFWISPFKRTSVVNIAWDSPGCMFHSGFVLVASKSLGCCLFFAHHKTRPLWLWFWSNPCIIVLGISKGCSVKELSNSHVQEDGTRISQQCAVKCWVTPC